jgi:hypothetical protein
VKTMDKAATKYHLIVVFEVASKENILGLSN